MMSGSEDLRVRQMTPRLEGGQNITNCETYDDVMSNLSVVLQGSGKTYYLSPIFCLLNLLLQP